ncbi:MAG: YtxH domain-containing protein [Bacteroidota bacterium]
MMKLLWTGIISYHSAKNGKVWNFFYKASKNYSEISMKNAFKGPKCPWNDIRTIDSKNIPKTLEVENFKLIIMNNIVRTSLTFLVGAGVGVAAGMLTAPRSGKQTREKISNEFDEKKNELESIANKKLDEAKNLLNQAVEKQTANGKKVLDKVKESATFS